MSELDVLRKENEELKAELKEVHNSTTMYLQNVSHQLTAPINAIKWSIEALKSDRVSLAKKGQLLSSLYSQGTILVHLIKNFTLLSNLEAEHDLAKLKEEPREVDMLKFCINLANDFQPQAKEKNTKILVDESGFEKVLHLKKLLIEKNLVAQAVSNVLENAVKYSASDSTIYISCFKTDDRVGFSVTSTGVPIAEGEVSNIFDRGFRGKAAQSMVPAGTGFGLYLVNRIMGLHKGEVKVDVDNKKTAFKLLFPENIIV